MIETLNGYKYTRTDLKDKTKKHIGVIAQEIEEIYPELIVENKDSGIKSVNYNGLSAVLIECVKSLKQENQELKEKNKNMENKLDLLINKMDALEKKNILLVYKNGHKNTIINQSHRRLQYRK